MRLCVRKPEVVDFVGGVRFWMERVRESCGDARAAWLSGSDTAYKVVRESLRADGMTFLRPRSDDSDLREQLQHRRWGRV